MDQVRGYLGTYASPRSRGIYTFTLDRETGQLSVPELYREVPDCKYLSLWRGILAAPVKRETGAGICLIDTRREKYHQPDASSAPKVPGASKVPDVSKVPETSDVPDVPDHPWKLHQQDSQELLTESVVSCYVAQDDRFVYTANYHEGTVSIYCKDKVARPGAEQAEAGGNEPNRTESNHNEPHRPGLDENTLELVKTIENGQGAGCHQVLLHDRYLMVPCLLQDRVRFFDREQGFAPAGELIFPKGTGPRHGCFDRDHRRFFLVSELSNQIFTYEVSGGLPGEVSNGRSIKPPIKPSTRPSGELEGGMGAAAFKLCERVELLHGQREGGTAPASAAIRLSPDERHLYVSTRFADVISVFKVDGTSLSMVQQTGSGGAGPRDFILTKNGRYLLAVNRSEGGLVCFLLNQEDGGVERMCSRVPVVEAVGIVLDETDETDEADEADEAVGR